jgi:hypothetical protein
MLPPGHGHVLAVPHRSPPLIRGCHMPVRGALNRLEYLFRRRSPSAKSQSAGFRRQPQWLLPVLCLGAFPWLIQPVKAGPPGDLGNDAQLRQAIAQAAQIAHPGAAEQSVTIRARYDLDEDLSKISGKAAHVSFYEAGPPPAGALADNDSVWAVLSRESPREPYGLYDFENSAGLQQSSREFNRLISQLSLSVTNDQAVGLAHFFLSCCAAGTPGEFVADEDMLHHTVERAYLQVYGDVWRTLEAFTDWWQGYTASAFQFPPAVQAEGGGYHITVERIVVTSGMHPQLQQCSLDISRDGTVRVLGVESIYPKQNRWLSYDFQSAIGPQIR